MPTDIIQAEYDTLEQIAAKFADQAQAYEQIIKMPLLLHPASATQWAELLTLLAQTPDPAIRSQLDTVMRAALHAPVSHASR